MTIRAGRPWGEPTLLPVGSPVANSDAELAAIASELLPGLLGSDADAGTPRFLAAEPPLVALTGGDLHRTVGSPKRSVSQLQAGEGIALPIDLGVVTLLNHEESRHIFAAHLIATSDPVGRLWKGRTVIIMNAAFRGAENLAPRGHPNDGRLDVIDGELRRRDRRRALERTYAGAHVPHPDLKESRVRQLIVESGAALTIVCDAVPLGTARRFSICCIADALRILV